MGIFDKFNDTIFYKKDNELEVQVEILKKLLEKYNNEELKHKLRICELGLYGENEIEFELRVIWKSEALFHFEASYHSRVIR